MCFGGWDNSGMTHKTVVPTRSLSDVPAREGGDQRRQASLGHLGLTPPQALSTRPPGFIKTPHVSSPEHTLHAYTNAQCAWRFSPIPGALEAGPAVDIWVALQLEHGIG